ncbi:phage portal protein [Iodidimonas gelatinilytica]|uniref:Phage portal protein n=2 Tax=Iodidimonas gelatinilytica TaxID=1236966 RepID=A0A5A7N0P2_9PROT|nr:phage portal protein [Iodidimonas gelatinilytica]
MDRLIASIDPVRGARRLAARRAVELHSRAYDAARRDHRTMSWRTTGASADAEIAMGGDIVRDRARDLVRNNGYAKKALDTLSDHVVGSGIMVSARGTSPTHRKRIARAFQDWSCEADWEGDLDFYGIQKLAIRAMLESGEVLIRLRRQEFDATTLTVPLKLQVLEADFIDSTLNRTLDGGGEIDRGIEYDAMGRKVAFWLLPAHPGEIARFTRRRMVSTRVPAEEIIHLFEKHRPGQDRGISIFAPVIMAARDLDQYFEAELVRKKIEACLAGFITSPNQDFPIDADAGKNSQSGGGRLAEKFEPGMLMRLREGEDIRIAAPAGTSGIAQFAEIYLREMACGVGIMYEQLTGDFSHVNYSSFRAGHHGFRRNVESIQDLNIKPRLLLRTMRRWREAALAAGLISNVDFVWHFTPPPFLSVDPEKDAKADLADLRMGKKTLSQIVEGRGVDYLDHLQQVSDDMAAADAVLPSGSLFDGDPRKQLRGQRNAAKDDDTSAEG